MKRIEHLVYSFDRILTPEERKTMFEHIWAKYPELRPIPKPMIYEAKFPSPDSRPIAVELHPDHQSDGYNWNSANYLVDKVHIEDGTVYVEAMPNPNMANPVAFRAAVNFDDEVSVMLTLKVEF
jgi:hypothetical protein